MIIVLFHVLYLFGKFVYQNYRMNKQKAIDDAMSAEVQLNISERDYKMRDPEAPRDFEEKPIRFSPPAYMQRYIAVKDVLQSGKYQGKIRKIVDFGCGDFGFFNYMKRTEGIEEILCVDVNRVVLEAFHEKVAPLVSEYLNRRPKPLVVEVYEGSVIQSDRKLENTDAVICIELIEHLHPRTLAKVPYNIFGYIKPKVAVITTPNADFNVLFPNFFRFRHHDHKFEWTRQQFQDWAENITLRYPYYTVTFEGICKGPEGSEHLGCCTQMAVFHRVYEFEFCNPGIENLFKLVTRYDYPFQIDNRSDEEKILDDATYYIRYLSSDPDLEEEIPLHTLLRMLYKFRISADALQVILEEAGWSIENREFGPVILVPPVSLHSNSDSSLEAAIEWNNESSADVWNSEHGPPIPPDSKFLQQRSSNVLDNEVWDEEPSIVIPQNNSIIEDNIYLYDEENVLLNNESETTRNTDISDRYSEINNEINNEENLDPILGTDNFNNSSDNNDASYVNESTELSDSSLTKKFEDFYTLDTQNSATSSTAVKLNRTLDLPIYMSVSRASTSPEPYLLDAVKMDRDLENNSMSNQSNYWMLNNSLDQENISINSSVDVNDVKNKKSSLKHNFNDCIHLHNNYLNTSYKEDGNSDIDANAEANTIGFNQSVQEDINTSKTSSYLEDELQSNSSVIFANSIPLDNQPQFTSSPKTEIKVNSINKKRRSLDYKEEKNSTNSLNVTQKYESNPSSDNLLKNRNEVLLHNNNDINITTISTVNSRDICTAVTSDISTYQNDIKKKSGNELINNANQDTLISDNIATISCTLNENLLDSNNSMKNDETLQTETKEMLAEEQKEFLANTNNIQSVIDTKIQLMIKSDSTEFINDSDGKTELKSELHDDCDLCVKNVNSTKMSVRKCNHAKDISNLENITLVSDHAKNTRDIESTSVLKSKKLIECNVENHESKCKNTNPNIGEFELKPSPETVESPSNSWSPEVMDSGYPNSASAQDMTPEYDLSSIAQDHISDSESPSIAEAPRLEIADVIEVENGDLANNNRDGEGNNMMAVELNNLEDLQPLIEVLENDIENENDIYAVENDFPIWLLRILNMANPVEVDIHIQDHRELVFPNRVAGNNARYVNMEHDEGFDSSSEENSDLENNEMRDNVNDANENALMNNVENDNENASNSDSGSEQWVVDHT